MSNIRYFFSLHVPIEMLFVALEKPPKEPWSRFAHKMNDRLGINFPESDWRIARAIAEKETGQIGKLCERITEAQFDAIKSLIRIKIPHSEIASVCGVSQSTVSRIHRFGINLEWEQINRD